MLQVCELDIIFNFEKAYFILDEFVIGGEVQETSKASVAKSMEEADSLQEVKHTHTHTHTHTHKLIEKVIHHVLTDVGVLYVRNVTLSARLFVFQINYYRGIHECYNLMNILYVFNSYTGQI